MRTNRLAHILQIIKSMLKKIFYCAAPVFLKSFLFIVFITCKWKVHNKNLFLSYQRKNSPILICCWHTSFLLVARYFKKISLGVWAVSSTHRDSEIMAKILRSWKFKLIKGSSTRGWSNVLKSMIDLFKKPKNIIAVTNDGPKGPPFVAKKGSISLALKYGAQIVAVSGTATHYWTLPSWDKTIIPKPFSTIHIRFSSPLSHQQDFSINDTLAVSKYINNNHNILNKKVHG